MSWIARKDAREGLRATEPVLVGPRQEVRWAGLRDALDAAYEGRKDSDPARP